jgi:carboxylesterase type B
MQGLVANNGLRDQRLALQWIKKHIEGFGGASDNVSVVGESAGGGKLHSTFAQTLLESIIF